MQFADVLCYIILTIIVTASCVPYEAKKKTEMEDPQAEKKVSKRDATFIIDNYPADRIFQKPKVIYRRTSRYGAPKPKYGPLRPKYKPSKATRIPGKKTYKSKPKHSQSSLHYRPPNAIHNQKRAHKQQPRYGSRKAKPNSKPGLENVQIPYYSFFVPDETGFGEPPVYLGNYQRPKPSYGEPPIDSYGAPLKPNIMDVFSTPQSFQETTHPFDNQDYNQQDYSIRNYKRNHPDANFAQSKNLPTLSESGNNIFVTPAPKDVIGDFFDTDVSEKEVMLDKQYFFKKKRPQYFTDNSKAVNKPWRPNKQYDLDEEFIVGGKYAEPPARYVEKFQANAPIYDDIEDPFSLSRTGFVDSVVASSANNSPYSNYKHSNMAFSPQNLNDAFSIVNK